jgi:DNA repair protein RadA
MDEELQSLPGIGKIMAEKLMFLGIGTVTRLATTPLKRLIDADFSKMTAQKILQAAQDRCMAQFGFLKGKELLQAQQRTHLTSGVNAIDKLLGGQGFESQKVYEIYGPAGAGKTELLHQLCCTASLPPEQHGLGTGAIYIDCEGSFSLHYLRCLEPRFNLEPDAVVKRIVRASPRTSDVLLYICEQQLPRLVKETGNRLICLDTLATYFRAEFREPQVWPERDCMVARVCQALRHVIEEVDGVAIISNLIEEVRTNFGKGYTYWGSPWHQDVHIRLAMRHKGMGPPAEFEVAVEKAFDLAPKKCLFTIGNEGLADLPPKRSYVKRSYTKMKIRGSDPIECEKILEEDC